VSRLALALNCPHRSASWFVWLTCVSKRAAERWMRQSLQLADSFYYSLHEGVGLHSLEVEGDMIVAVDA